MSDPKMEKLAQVLASNPKLQQAAMSGMAAALSKELKASGLDKQIDSSVIASLGKMKVGGTGGGSPIAADYVARGVSSVLAVVKVRVEDLANELSTMAKLQNKTDIAVKALQKGGIIK